ncbi:MAG: phytoene/squalene synthase family protein [Candidatus Saccharimonadales bacterium]
MNSLEDNIFRNGSKTYYWSSKFFPADVRDDVFKFYSFVRVADDYVDCVPARAKKFYALREAWDKAKKDEQFNTVRRPQDTVDERIVKNIIDVVRNYDCDYAWIESFLDSMESDLSSKHCKSLDDTLNYVYGSAEVIGLVMSRIMGLPQEASSFAQLQGRAMQYMNFIRDIDEDNKLHRCYFPEDDLSKFQLHDLSKSTCMSNEAQFEAFMHHQINRYRQWQQEANKGMNYIPLRMRVPLLVATDLFNWTINTIERNPVIVFDKKVKPTKLRLGISFIKAVAQASSFSK